MNSTKAWYLFSILFIYIIISASTIKANHYRQARPTWSHAITGGIDYPNQDNPPTTVAAFYSTKDIDYPVNSNTLVAPTCTGSFITNEFVLTAKHCLTRFKSDYVPPPIESIYVVYRKPQYNKYVIDGIKQVIYYNDPNIDIALVKLKKPYPNLPNPVSTIYHGYDLQTQAEISKHQVIAYGYGNLADSQDGEYFIPNYTSTLKMLYAIPMKFSYDHTNLLIRSNSGALVRGDSGGPTTYDNYLIALVSNGSIETNTNNLVVLSQSILQWLANSIYNPIFKTPLSYGYLKESNNSIVFTGWGRIPPNTILTVSEQSYQGSSPVGICNKFITTSNALWKCQVNLKRPPDPSKYYQGVLINNITNIKGDSVLFSMNAYGKDLKILQPEPSSDMYTFNISQAYTNYIIKGSGTPGDSIKYKLTKLSNGFTNFTPCNIANNSVIPDNGLWQCQMLAPNSDESYLFVASVPNDKENSNVKVIVSTKYKIHLITESINIQSDPNNGDTVYGNHVIQIKLTKLPSDFIGDLFTLLSIDNGRGLFRNIPIVRENDGSFVYNRPINLPLIDSSFIPDYSKAILGIAINNNNPSIPIIDKTINYSIFNYRVFITSLANRAQVVAKDIKISGNTNLKKTKENPTNYKVEVAIEYGTDEKAYCRTQVNLDGTWSCPTNNNSLFDTGKEYNISATLDTQSDVEYRAITKIVIKVIHPGKIKYPSKAKVL